MTYVLTKVSLRKWRNISIQIKNGEVKYRLF